MILIQLFWINTAHLFELCDTVVSESWNKEIIE